MVEIIGSYRFLIIVATLLITTLIIESPFTFRHTEEPPTLLYFAILFITTIVYLIPSDKLITAEKLILSLFIVSLSMLGGLWFTNFTLGALYGYDDYFGYLESPDLLESFTFYFTSSLLSIGAFSIILK